MALLLTALLLREGAFEAKGFLGLCQWMNLLQLRLSHLQKRQDISSVMSSNVSLGPAET